MGTSTEEIERYLRGSDEFDQFVTPSPEMNTLVDRILGLSATDSRPAFPKNIGRYAIASLMGEGAHAKVFRAFDPQLNRHVALKVAKKTTVANPKARDLFLREAQLAAAIDHPGIVPVFEFGDCPELGCYMVMPSVEGNTLEHVLESKPFSIERCVEFAISIAEAMSHAHERGLVHRDLKPANILVDANGNPRIADFGLAVHLDAVPIDQTEGLAGTPHYMAPEQVSGENHRVDARTDVWAFGVTLFELLTREKPFTGATIRELFAAIESAKAASVADKRSDLPDGLTRIVSRCLSKRMADRYSSFNQLLAELRSLDDEQVTSSSIAAVATKGLEPFDGSDANSFLRLLPGVPDAEGLPPSIRFWKDRIESPEGASSFEVGLLCGPSGSGKSSLVRAGLLPHLSDNVTSIFVSASPSGTESELVAGLRRRFHQIEDGSSLPNALMTVRHQLATRPQLRLLIVIDQFEQWLSANRLDGAELVDGLRHCDGNVSALILVRDEFWSKTLYLMEAIEVSLAGNVKAKEPMTQDHAAHVLAELGYAHGKLPQPDTVTATQRQFLRSAVRDMAESDDSVKPIRLAMFAQMMANREWHSRSLKRVGGADGIGERYLESLFGESAISRAHREHAESARRVLRQLLPPNGVSIRQEQVSFDEIQRAVGGSPENAERVTSILVDAKLIVPAESNSTETAVYQLPHDYLIPVIRNWISRHETDSIQGRAMRLLETRTDLWMARKEKRQLPSLIEWASISLATRRHDRTRHQRDMLRVATRQRVAQLCVVAALLAITSLAGSKYFAENTYQTLLSKFERQAYGKSSVALVEQLLPNRHRWIEEFERRVDSANTGADTKRKCALALLIAYSAEKDFSGDRIRVVTNLLQQHPIDDWYFTIEAVQQAGLLPFLKDKLNEQVTKTEREFEAYLKGVPPLVKETEAPPEESVQNSKQLVMASLFLDDDRTIQDCLSHNGDPRLGTLITHQIAEALETGVFSADRLRTLIRQCADARNWAALQRLIHAADIYARTPTGRLLKNRDSQLAQIMRELYVECPDAAVHWSARRMLVEYQTEIPHAEPVEGANWITLGTDLEFSVVPMPGISREIAFGCVEITNQIFNRYTRGNKKTIPPQEDNCPVKLTQQEAMRFCRDLNIHLQREQCYRENAERGFVYPVDEYVRSNGVRLPLLAEWNVAFAGGAATHNPIGYNTPELLSFYEWNASNSNNDNQPCGQLLPNPYGLFDMMGNAREWLQDTKTREEPLEDRRLPPTRLHTADYDPDQVLGFSAGFDGALPAQQFSVRSQYHPRAVGSIVQRSLRIVFSIPDVKQLAKDF